ncbi:hypothetical protein BO83DRAFT_404233 [Aspergillus eucalypticola CBS 122712]|uniref:DUF567-domain-containing protein n=1 Tax=Aspergillus eucalypticola (strain CBS 122712 / IBT 29274) TaxID=1448314 RepID=A0A317UIR2_ASPEC|nr:uncharacterized protein BO83DRAFT_404233 [Aspergillus eucalypticola CBS 122712]PWY61974.1 hypothetical protein BO83DRAFT_404233 [Aspergillus eucalypticola CBS 122712]
MHHPHYLNTVSQPVALFEHFITSEPQAIVLKEKIFSFSTDSFDIKLGEGVLLLKVTGNIFSVSGCKNVEDMEHNHLFNIHKEHMHLHTTFIGSKATATCTDRHSNQNNCRTRIINENTEEQVTCITRRWFTTCYIFFGQDTYNVIVASGVDIALIAGSCIYFDEKNND